MRGAREGTYREVWCALYELSIGEETTAPDLAKQIVGLRPNRQSTHRAFKTAEDAGLIQRIQGGPGFPAVWRRLELPEVLTVEALMGRGMPTWAAWNFLRALESGGYLKHEPGQGYRRAE